MSKTKRKGSSKDTFDKKKFLANLDLTRCVFCNQREDNGVCGKKISKLGLTVHYFCMLFSSGLSQNGQSQEDGILGFLPNDIIIEVRRGTKLKCSFCKTKGATIGCVVGACRKVFHFGCGQAYNTLHQYFGNFSSFCEDHRPRQMIPVDRLSLCGKSNATCAICMTAVTPNVMSNDTIRAPCCGYAWFHRECIQKHATTAGLYFFKCPLCNNKDVFQDEMLHFGIFIPEQDAAWELEPGAYDDLLERYMKCDAVPCKCPNGREYHKDGGKWEVLVCDWCGAQGTHVECRNLLKIRDDYVCKECKEVDDKCTYKSKRRFTKSNRKRSKGKYGEDARTAENTRLFQEKFQRASLGSGATASTSKDQNLPSTSAQSLQSVSSTEPKKVPSTSSSRYGRKKSRTRRDLLRNSKDLLHLYYEETEEELDVVETSQDEQPKSDNESKMNHRQSRSRSCRRQGGSKMYSTRSRCKSSPPSIESQEDMEPIPARKSSRKRKGKAACVRQSSSEGTAKTHHSEQMSKQEDEQKEKIRGISSSRNTKVSDRYKKEYTSMYKKTPMLSAYRKRRRRKRKYHNVPLSEEKCQEKEEEKEEMDTKHEEVEMEKNKSNTTEMDMDLEETETERNKSDTEYDTDTEGMETSIDINVGSSNDMCLNDFSDMAETLGCSKEKDSGTDLCDFRERKGREGSRSHRKPKKKRTNPILLGYVRRRIPKCRIVEKQKNRDGNAESKTDVETETDDEGDKMISMVDTDLPVLEKEPEVIHSTEEILDQAPVLDAQTDTSDIIERQTDTNDEESEDDIPFSKTRSRRRLMIKNRKRKCKKIKKKLCSQDEYDFQSEYGYVTTDYEIDSETEDEDNRLEAVSNDENQLDKSANIDVVETENLARNDTLETVQIGCNYEGIERKSDVRNETSERRGRSRRRSRSCRRDVKNKHKKPSGTLELTADPNSKSRSRSQFRRSLRTSPEEEINFHGMMTRSRSRSRTRAKLSKKERFSLSDESPSRMDHTYNEMSEDFDTESEECSFNDDNETKPVEQESQGSSSKGEKSVDYSYDKEQDLWNKSNESISLNSEHFATTVKTRYKSTSKRKVRRIGDTVKLQCRVKSINRRISSSNSKVSVLPIFTSIDCGQLTSAALERSLGKPKRGRSTIHDVHNFDAVYKVVEGKRSTYKYYISTKERYNSMSFEDKERYKARVTKMRKRREMLKRLANIKSTFMTTEEKERYLELERELIAQEAIEKKIYPLRSNKSKNPQSSADQEADLENHDEVAMGNILLTEREGNCLDNTKTPIVNPKIKRQRLLSPRRNTSSTAVPSLKTFQSKHASSFEKTFNLNDIHIKELGEGISDPFDFDEYEKAGEEDAYLKSIKSSPSRMGRTEESSIHNVLLLDTCKNSDFSTSTVDEAKMGNMWENERFTSENAIAVSESATFSPKQTRIKQRGNKVNSLISDEISDCRKNSDLENDFQTFNSDSSDSSSDSHTPDKEPSCNKETISKSEEKRNPGRPPGALNRTTLWRMRRRQKALDRLNMSELAVPDHVEHRNILQSKITKCDENGKVPNIEITDEDSGMNSNCQGQGHDPEGQTQTENLSNDDFPVSTLDVEEGPKNEGVKTPSRKHFALKKPKGFLMRNAFRFMSKDAINSGFINRVLKLLNKPENETSLTFVELINSHLPLLESKSSGRNNSLEQIARKYNSPHERTRNLRSSETVKRSSWKPKTRTPNSTSKISSRNSFSNVEKRRVKSEVKRGINRSRTLQESFEEKCTSSAKKALNFNDNGKMNDEEQSQDSVPVFSELLNVDSEIKTDGNHSFISSTMMEQFQTSRCRKPRDRQKQRGRKYHVSDQKNTKCASTEEEKANDCVISEVQAMVASNALVCPSNGDSLDQTFNENETEENSSDADTLSYDGDNLHVDMDTDELCEIPIPPAASTPVRSEGKGHSANSSPNSIDVGVRKSPLFEIL